MVRVYFGDKLVADRGGIYDANNSVLTQKIYLEYEASASKLFTVIIWSSDYGEASPYLLLLVVNVPGSKIEQGDLLVEWDRPLAGRGYTVSVYEQDHRIRPHEHEVRQKFALDKFIERHQLLLFEQTYFKIGAPAGPIYPHYEIPVRGKKDWFKAGTSLSEQEQKYCRCTLEVAAKQTDACLADRSKQGKGGCYSPFAVCAKSTRTSLGRRSCMEEFDMNKIPTEFLRAYAIQHQIPLGDESHSSLKQNIESWKAREGKR